MQNCRKLFFVVITETAIFHSFCENHETFDLSRSLTISHFLSLSSHFLWFFSVPAIIF